VRGFKWEHFWANENNEFNLYQDAWRAIWARYAHEPSVLGYDLINEPRRYEMEISYDDLTTQYLLPYHRALIDEKNKFSPQKVAICQAIFMNKGEGIEHNQYAEIKEPLDRDNAYFSPHIYLDNSDWVAPVLARLEREADLWNAPMFIGEWGFPTYESTDTSFEQQQEYTKLYIDTAAAFDALGVGTIKAWFSGNRSMQNFLPKGKSTWAIFSDKQDVGTVERKYITDVIARPYPQSIAGDIQFFAFDHATRSLRVDLVSDNSKGASRIFIGADRHYPDGFSIVCGDDIVLGHNPLRSGGLELLKAPANLNPLDYVWNVRTQQLTILQWPTDQAKITLRILPGIQHDL
jgi:endoglycosylceramidase